MNSARSLAAGSLAAVGFLCLYYAGLGLMPPTRAGFNDYHPLAAWHDRLDLAQFVGVFLIPPWPTPSTWLAGFAALVVGLAGLAAVYSWLLIWSRRRPTLANGTLFGLGLFVGLGFLVWLAPGFHPGVMRGALPDAGFFFLGWNGPAALHVLLCCAVYGAVMGSVSHTQ